MNSIPVAELVQLLARSRFFQGLQPADLEVVLEAAHNHRVDRGAFFFHQGDPATHFYLLVEGRVRLLQLTPEGHQVILHFVGPGEGLGIVAVLSQMAYPVAAEAMEPCQAVAWEGETILRLMEHYPRLALNALALVAARFRELQDRYRELATQRVERRVAHTLLRLARQTGQKVEAGVLIDLPLSRQDLAEMAGTTLYTVSRILSRWEQEGLIETGRERVVIRYPHGLVVIAEDLPPANSS